MTIDEMVNKIIELEQRINDLEVELSNLRVEFKFHDHPYKPEPRYG